LARHSQTVAQAVNIGSRQAKQLYYTRLGVVSACVTGYRGNM